MRVVALFCGSRDWADMAAIRADIAELPADAIVIEGGARGADRLARSAARERGLHVATVEAQWNRLGKSAGFWRNEAMLALGPTVVYAYPLGGPGTASMVRLATAAGVPVVSR